MKSKNQKFGVFDRQLCAWGLRKKQDLVNPFPPEFLNRLRPFLCGGIPANIWIALNELCKGKCYDRAPVAALGLDDCEVVHAKIESLWNPQEGYEYAGHAFIECGNKVYDTTAGMVFDRDFYYDLEKPNIENRFTKDEIINGDLWLQSMLAEDVHNGKFAMPLLLPMMEDLLNKTNNPATQHYKPYILRELDEHKCGINYGEFIREETINKDLFFSDPKALDEKLGIVRDEYGTEMSRGGVPNPYYKKTDPKDWISADYYTDEFQLAPNELDEINRQMEEENNQMREKAQKRLAKIALNPTAFAYEIDGADMRK